VILFSKYELPLGKTIGFLSDGAQAMAGKKNSVAAKKVKQF
jgi:hypothetical protein